MSTNAYMEQPNYPAHYAAMPDRSAQVFGTESHEPRAPRPFEATHTASNDPYATAAVPAHPQPGAMAEAHSPMSSYRGSFSHASSMGLPHHRQDSITSISSPHDVSGGGWAPSSPGLTASRHASIYSLNGQFDQVGLGSSIDSGSTASHFYDQSPPLHAQVRYAQGQAADARRFSLDERAIRTQPQLGKSGLVSADYQVPGGSSGRHWPWGANSSSAIHGRHASVSAAPPQGYDHNRMAYGANSGMQPGYGYDPNAMSPRYRSMSSSAASGRGYGNAYGAPGTAAHAAAAMGYGMAPHLGPGMMLDGDLVGGPGPARRAKFKRSRTGCLVCRKRKVKCSQDGTPCKQCRIGKRDCHYDDSPQKKKPGKKERSAGSIDAGSSDKGSNGVAPGLAHLGADQQSNGHLSSTDPYYATMGALDHRDSNASQGGVTFSMPFQSQPAPVATHSSSTDTTWANPSPFAPGPHGQTHTATHQVPAHQDGYGWPSKQEHDPTQQAPPAAYADPSVDRNAAYWSQHPTAYAPRTNKLEVSES
ncbi:Zn(2)-C6 fungal-type DNA-binding domain protein [Kalmanozyma brasiliensis GHG001]|uniref:60S ribosomal protein L7 n=1 Tax=Kalmanozyma brasiliensis (strain GHG001) TaxID=1365824 RepID=V5EL03_KALBG|nr:Zn(2)-C6 fungal-type DNA-binding domain protein [Kalmanozyma brasiliensis GHG001]EST05685.1 Zn(2)-C6 fungal-type DNA-binding domain protein [Kalmanozyma brasiliensis GHG001]